MKLVYSLMKMGELTRNLPAKILADMPLKRIESGFTVYPNLPAKYLILKLRVSLRVSCGYVFVTYPQREAAPCAALDKCG
jgi:hypothetical protein